MQRALIARDALEAVRHVSAAEHYPRGADGPIWPADPAQLETLIGRPPTEAEIGLWEAIATAKLDPEVNTWSSSLADSSGFSVTETAAGWLVEAWTTISGRVTGQAYLLDFGPSGFGAGSDLSYRISRSWGEPRVAELLRDEVEARADAARPSYWGLLVVSRGYVVGGDPWPPERIATAERSAKK